MLESELQMLTQAPQLEIIAYESVGSLRFGMSEAEVRAQLGPQPAVREPARSCDSFRELGIRVHYDLNGETEAIEFRGPARPTLQGRPLLGQAYESIEAWFSSLDPMLKLEHSGLTSMELGIRVYASSAKRLRNTPIEVVTVFGRDYCRQYIASMLPPAP